MKSLIIGMDVDDVVLDLITEWLYRYNSRTDDNVLPEDILSWDIQQYCPKMSKEDFFKILHEPDLYDRVKPMEGARKVIYQLLSMGHRVVYITSCVGMSAYYKKLCLRRYGLLTSKNKHRDFISASDKSLVSGVDVLFDDRPENVQTFKKAAYLVDRPHNRRVYDLPRVTLKDIPLKVALLARY